MCREVRANASRNPTRALRKVKQSQAEMEIAGFQALYAIPGRVSVDNTGTAKNVRIGTQEIEAQLSARAVPKLDPTAYLTAGFTLNGESPLLPGTAMLYRDGVFMGQGWLPLLSPGEETRLGFGADDLVKVKRQEVKRERGEEERSHVDGLGSWGSAFGRVRIAQVETPRARPMSTRPLRGLPRSATTPLRSG